MSALSVLIVDDCDDTASSTARLIEFAGHATRIAHCAEEALELVEIQPPDVVLIDVCMPMVDGAETTRRINACTPYKPPLVIAMSGSNTERDRRRMAEAGSHLYLLKPVDPAMLIGLMTRLARAIFRDGPEVATEADMELRYRRIKG